MAMDSNKARPARDEVLSLLDDLDSIATVPGNPTNSTLPASAISPTKTTAIDTNTNPKTSNIKSSAGPGQSEDAQSVLDFLDEITQRSATPTPSISTKKLNAPATRSLSRKASSSSMRRPSGEVSRAATPQAASPSDPAPANATSGGWGWGAVLKQATSTVLSQAKSAAGQVQSVVADPSRSTELVKNLNSNLQNQLTGQTETAKKWKEGMMNYVKASGIDQLGKDLQATGLKSLTDIMNMVAPPISQHEIIEVQLSYDMVGYDGIETLVYRSLSKIMEQVDGGDLVLNKGDEEKAKPPEEGEPERDLKAIEGMAEGYKLAANLEQMIKKKSEAAVDKPEQPTEDSEPKALPITRCPVYVRIQPILAKLPVFNQSVQTKPTNLTKGISVDEEQHLFFLILLRDVNNSLDHATLTQSVPASWLEIPFEENEWVEDVMVEVIKRGTETIGQQYVNGRLSGRAVRNATEQTPDPTLETSQKA